jgi:parallel beta-helix repeat protein
MQKNTILKIIAGLFGILLLVLVGIGNAQVISSIETQSIEPSCNVVLSYTVHSPITINTDAQFQSQGFPGNGSLTNPYIIAGFSITSTGTCISIEYTSVHFIIRDCLLNGGDSGNGVDLIYANNGMIQKNTIIDKYYGIYTDHADDMTFFNNTISDNYMGIYVYKYSDRNHVINNTVTGSTSTGILLSQDPQDAVVANNTITSSMGIGIGTIACLGVTIENNVLSGHIQYGIFLSGSPNNTVAQNIIFDNDVGIYTNNDGNRILNNTIRRNNIGISFTSTSDENLVSLNEFILNVVHNANDDGDSNNWNMTIYGNYWSDYTGSGVYNIPGEGGAIDYHPFIYDAIPPSINHPSDLNYTVGTIGHSVTFEASDDHPSYYLVLKNNSIFATAPWDGGTITINVDGLQVGVYEFKIIVYDSFGNTATDTFIVTVYPPDTGILFLAMAGGFGVIIVMVIIIKLRKS